MTTAGAGSHASEGPALLAFSAVALPGAAAPASLDYVAYEPRRERIWVPVGDTGSVDVFDIALGTFTRVDGFKTAERDVRGAKRTMGPSAVAIGDGFAYVGNRATGEVCSVSVTTLTVGRCLKLASSTDGVAYVRSVKEVWVTAPRSQSIVVLDASTRETLSVKATLKLDGAPEGYASDDSRGVFLTNLEDKNKTVVVDLATRTLKGSWDLDCESDGPRGIAADVKRGFVYVACTDHVLVLDAGHNGAKLGRLDTGPGVDNIDWLEAKGLLFAAAGKGETVVVAHIDDAGHPSVVAKGASTRGARNAVADTSGNVYVADPVHARLLVFPFQP
jgi:DNA-binding beta-propeller fold protein YncE